MDVCPYCEAQVSASARKCRHCGEWLVQVPEAHQPKSATREVGSASIPTLQRESKAEGRPSWWDRQRPIARGLWVTLGVLSLVVIMTDPAPSNPVDPQSDFALRVRCQLAIKNQLTSPSSAEFLSGDRVVRYDAGRAIAQGTVEAENAFGATVRTGYVCEGRHEAGEWKIVGASVGHAVP